MEPAEDDLGQAVGRDARVVGPGELPDHRHDKTENTPDGQRDAEEFRYGLIPHSGVWPPNIRTHGQPTLAGVASGLLGGN